MQEANKNLTQEEKQALRKAKKMEKAQKAATAQQKQPQQQPAQQKPQQPQQKPQQQQQQRPQQQQQRPQQQKQQPTQPIQPAQPIQPTVKPIVDRLVMDGSERVATEVASLSGVDTNTIHPTFLQLALLFSSHEVRGASRRAEYLLKAMKELISSMTALPDEELIAVCNLIEDMVYLLSLLIHPFHPLSFFSTLSALATTCN